MLKFHWSLRCWETLQGKNESRPLLEEAAAAVHRLGLVPMPQGSALRLLYDEMVSHGRSPDAMPPHAAMGGNAPPGNPNLAHGHTSAHGDALMHAAPIGVPPVAAGVLRDLHQEGALNGDGVGVWGPARTASPEQQRATAATGASVAAEVSSGGDAGGVARAHSEGMGPNHVSVVPVVGQWGPPTAPATQPVKRKAGVAFAEHPSSSGGPADAEW